MDSKQEMRKIFLERRDSLSEEEVSAKSASVFERLCSLNKYKTAGVILVYMSFRNEVMTGRFIERCIRDGKRVALPRVEAANGGSRVLVTYEISDPVKDIKLGYKGILEPVPCLMYRLDPCDIDLAVIPGTAFDIAGNRMGYGAGFYDRFLPLLRADCLKAGAAFEIQIAESLPTDAHDFRMDMIITERRSIICTDI